MKHNGVDSIRLCVIIPTYNNAGTIRQVISAVAGYCQDVIVVNDGSTDDTATILDCLPTPITLVSCPKNKGKGHALVKGFLKAKEMGFTHAITIDADGQHYPDDIPLFIKEMEANPEGIIVGCRNLTEKNMPRQNTFANRFSNFWFRLQTGINLSDTQSGFRLYNLSALRLLKLITSRYEAELELLVLPAWMGTPISTVNVRVYYPPAEERVSHFRPVYDFSRISVLNTILCIVALFFRSFYYIKQTLYTIFSLCYFIVDAMILTVIGFLLITIGGASEKHKYLYHKILQKNAWFTIHHVPGTKFIYHNPQGEAFQKPSIIISNHQSHLDLMAIMMLTPKLIILTKKWVWHSPYYGVIIRYADFFPISDMDDMIKKMQAKVNEGYSVMIFPEGTRSKDCKLGLFQRGAFYLAEQLKLDILPVFIKGFGKVLPKKSYYLRPGKMTLEVKPCIYRDQLTAEENYRELSRRIRRQYLKWNHEEVKLYKHKH